LSPFEKSYAPFSSWKNFPIYFILIEPSQDAVDIFSLSDMSMFARGHGFSKTVPYGLSQTAFFGNS